MGQTGKEKEGLALGGYKGIRGREGQRLGWASPLAGIYPDGITEFHKTEENMLLNT